MNKKPSILLLAMLALAGNAFGQSTSPNGNSASEIFYIDDADDLVEFAKKLTDGNSSTTSVVVRHDIDCSNVTIEPMGTYWGPYSGTFDGGGHKFSNLHISSSEYPIGLFRYVGGGAMIKDLTLDETCSIVSTGSQMGSSVAAFAGEARVVGDDVKTVTFDGCCNKAKVSGYRFTAGIIGANNEKANLVIQNCCNIGTIQGSIQTSAICGQMCFKGSITNCWNAGTVSESDLPDNIDFCGIDEEADVKLNGNCSVNTTQAGITSFKPADVASGRLCYLMNGSQSGSVANGWYQHLYDGSNTYPTRNANDDNKVYAHQNHYCNQTAADNFEVYDNSPDQPAPIHVFDGKGFCHATTGETHYQAPDIVNNVCQISNAGNLYWYAAKYNADEIGNSAELTADIVDNDALFVNGALRSDLSDARIWVPIGTAKHPFSARSFQGNYHTISGLLIPNSYESPNYSGLFSWACNQASITNLGIVDSFFYGKKYAGSFVASGYNPDDLEDYLGPILHNCYSTGEVQSGGCAGGIAAILYHGSQQNYNNNVTHCYSTCNVSSPDKLNSGSLFGFLAGADLVTSYTGTLNHCYYLEGKNTGCKANEGNDYGTPKSALAFQLGEVCQLLSDEEGWTQQLGADASPKFGAEQIRYKRNVSSVWGSAIVPYSLASTSDVQYYTFSRLDNEQRLHLKAVETVAPNVPCFFKVPEGTEVVDFGAANTITLPASQQVTMEVESQPVTLIGTYADLQVDGGGQNYFVAQDQFWWGEEAFSVSPFRAYLQLTSSSPARAKNIELVVGDETDGISEVKGERLEVSDGIYLANGKIVIRKNGKKYNTNGQGI